MTNNKWCKPKDIKTLSRSRSPNLEHLTIFLPSSMVIIIDVYIPPQADTDMALLGLHDVVCRHQTQYPDVAVVVVGAFSRANLKKVMPKFHQHITCATKGRKNFGPLLYAIQERLQGCLSSPIWQVGPCHHFPK